MSNDEIKQYARGKRIPLWKIAVEIGVSEPTMTRWMRLPLSIDRQKRILSAISKIEKEGD